MTGGSARRSRERAIAVAVAAVAIAAAAGAGLNLVRQNRILASTAMLDAQTLALTRGDPAIADAGEADAGTPPRALVNLALIDARAGEASRDGARRTRLLARATRRIDAALAARPRWGEAQTVAAYVAAARTGRAADPAVLRSIAASYRDAPMLRHGGAWRVGVGLDNYPRLDPATRRRLIEEAVWLARVDNPARTQIFDRARGSAGYRDLLARWHLARYGDADTVAREVPAP